MTPFYSFKFVFGSAGKNYKIGMFKKKILLLKFFRNQFAIKSASTWLEHLVMAEEIFKIPANVKGSVIECGCFQGGSTSNLSLACKLVKRKLIVCDSFQGLPEPKKSDKHHVVDIGDKKINYKKGQYTGSLKKVKSNIKKYGDLSVCTFVKGYFEDTLKNVNDKSVFIFLDVDLNESLKTCLIYLWPNLTKNCLLYSHEAQDFDFCKIFYDNDWWKKNVKCSAPGFIGAGTGLPLMPGYGSSIGYSKKQ